jgi:hypothetical protein
MPEGTVKPRRRWRNKLLLAAGFGGGSLVLAELVLRLVLGNLAMPMIGSRSGDGRCVQLRPGTSVEYTGWFLRVPTVHVDANAFGYRGPAVPREKPGDTLRILLVGDSFTYGMGVEQDQTLSAWMERGLRERLGRRVEVLNFGIPGLNVEDALVQYRHFAAAWEHDLVLYASFDNDFDASICGLLEKPATLWLLKNVYVFRAVSLALNPHVIPQDRSSTEARDRRLAVVFDGFREVSTKRRAVFAHVALGKDVPASTRRLAEDRGIEQYELAAAGCPAIRDGVPCIPGEGHFSAEGNRLVASCVSSWLVEAGLAAGQTGGE